MAGKGRPRLAPRLLVPFLAIPFAMIAVSGYIAWLVNGWAAERTVDQQLGDKLEVAVDVVRQLVRERVETTERLAAAADPAALRATDLDLVLIVHADGRRQTVRAARGLAVRALDATLESLLPESADRDRRFALVAAGDMFLAVAAASAPSDRVLVTARRFPPGVLHRFTALTGSEMGVFADWQRARVTSFDVDIRRCHDCHADDWRVPRIGGDAHLARSFNGRAFYVVGFDDGFRYAFMPLEIGGRRMAMLAVRQPRAALAAARLDGLAVVSGGGVLAAVSSFVAWWMASRRLRSALGAVEHWIESLAAGRGFLEPPIEVRGEVERLALSLAPTVAALRESRDQLSRVNDELNRLVGVQSTTISSMRTRLGTFLDVARAPETAPEAEEVAAEMLRHLGRLFGYTWARMIFVDPADDSQMQCVALGPSGAGRVAYDAQRDPVLLSAARRSRLAFHLEGALGASRSALVVPLVLRDQTVGALALGERRGPHAGEDPDVETLEALVRQGVMALEHSFLYRRAQEAYVHTTAVLVTTIESKDAYLRGHSDRVARMTVATAPQFGIADGALRVLEQLARFHDVGKICIDLSILQKPARLTDEEYDAIKRHPEIGEAIVSQIGSLRSRAHIVGQHHERYDGRGYGAGLGGDDIAFEARIVAVCDAFDAMTSTRAYRAPLDAAAAAAEIRAHAGRQFDPRVAAVFADVVLRQVDAAEAAPA